MCATTATTTTTSSNAIHFSRCSLFCESFSRRRVIFSFIKSELTTRYCLSDSGHLLRPQLISMALVFDSATLFNRSLLRRRKERTHETNNRPTTFIYNNFSRRLRIPRVLLLNPRESHMLIFLQDKYNFFPNFPRNFRGERDRFSVVTSRDLVQPSLNPTLSLIYVPHIIYGLIMQFHRAKHIKMTTKLNVYK